MPRERFRLFSCKFICKYNTLNRLKRRLLRNILMSGGSPYFKRYYGSRRRTIRIDAVEQDSRDDHPRSPSFVVLSPTSSKTKNNCSPCTSPERSDWNTKIKARRPLHPLSDISPIRKSSDCYKYNSGLGVHCDSNRKSSPEDDVSFIKELSKAKSDMSLSSNLDRSNKSVLPIEDDCVIQSDSESPSSVPTQSRCFESTDVSQKHITDTMDVTNYSVEKSKRDPKNIEKDCDVIDLSHDGVDGECDDDLVVVTNACESIDSTTLKGVIRSVICNFIADNNPSDLTTKYVLSRLKSLYHRDFSDRTKEIEDQMRQELKQSSQVMLSCQEIRPGVRLVDIDTLSYDNWLNDIIIDQYMAMLVKGNCEFAAISSFWYEELLRGTDPMLPNDWNNLQMILVPTCIRSHWTLFSYIPSKNTVHVCSSLPAGTAELYCAKILHDVFSKTSNVLCADEGVQIKEGLPRQANEHDCGVYVCMFARCLVCGNSFDISPEQVVEFRGWLKNEIIKGRLFNYTDEDSD